MTIFLRLLPLFVGMAVSYSVALSVAASSRPTKFVVVLLTVLCLGYAFTWFNIYLSRRSGDLLNPLQAGAKVQGHLLMFAGAFVAGYGYSANNKLALLAALACLWFADDRLTPRATRVRAQAGRQQLPQRPGELTSEEQALLDTALQDREKFPVAGALFGSKVALRRLLDMMTQTRAIHMESLLCALGALAGYACQASLREFARSKGMDETVHFVVAKTADGATYFFGDPLNEVLAESEASVWRLVATAAREAGCTDLPDKNEMFSYVTSTVGHDNFGSLRVPAKHASMASPLQMLEAYWPTLAPLAQKFCATPGELPILFAMAIKDAIALSKSDVPPATAFRIVMESAIPMSKIDLHGGGTKPTFPTSSAA